MKFTAVFLPVLIFSAVSALAEVGDIHTVKVNSAIVREAPGKSARQVDKLSAGAEIMEMGIEGKWYEIYVASTDMEGWMHVSTLALLGGGAPAVPVAKAAPAKAAKTPKPPPTKVVFKSSGSKSRAMKDFEKLLLKYNARTSSLKGYVPFSAAVDKGNGELHLTVTDQWLEKSSARQKSSLITMYTRWKSLTDAANPKVYAVDTSGNPIINYPK